MTISLEQRPTSIPKLAARFGQNANVLRGDSELSDDQMRRVAPSIFAGGQAR